MSITESPSLVRVVDGNEVPVEGTYSLDPSHTHVGFAVRHLMVSKVHGRFAGVSGTVHIADDPIDSSVEVEIDTATVDTRDDGRDTHLRSPDFFDVENYPKMTYRSTKVTKGKRGQWLVDGDLTLHGVTRPVELDVSFEGGEVPPWGGAGQIGFSASGKLNREEFGLSWNAALETGGVVVGKDITLEIEAEAVRS